VTFSAVFDSAAESLVGVSVWVEASSVSEDWLLLHAPAVSDAAKINARNFRVFLVFVMLMMCPLVDE
jgi:hypothetical protein